VKRLAVSLLAAALALLPVASRAGELDLSGDWSGFSSPDEVYGPWRSLTGTFRWQANLKDTPSVSLVTRADQDRLAPTNSNGLVVDDYHDFSARFFGYAAVGLAAGTVLPTRDFYIEGDGKFGRGLTLVWGTGLGLVVNPNGLVQRYVNFGPTFYGTNWNIGFRYLQTETIGRTGTGTGILTVEAGQTGKTISTLTLLAGSQPPNGIATPSEAIAFGQRTVLAGFGIKHWTSPKGGFLAGIEVERLNDRLTGTGLYARRGFTLGIFRDIGPALP
jgi:YaiO family outer membrane protein